MIEPTKIGDHWFLERWIVTGSKRRCLFRTLLRDPTDWDENHAAIVKQNELAASVRHECTVPRAKR